MAAPKSRAYTNHMHNYLDHLKGALISVEAAREAFPAAFPNAGNMGPMKQVGDEQMAMTDRELDAKDYEAT